MTGYKIIALAQNQIENEEILIAVVSKINVKDGYENFIITKNYVFVFPLYSEIATNISKNPENLF